MLVNARLNEGVIYGVFTSVYYTTITMIVDIYVDVFPLADFLH